jgi:hypothetical protein
MVSTRPSRPVGRRFRERSQGLNLLSKLLPVLMEIYPFWPWFRLIKKDPWITLKGVTILAGLGTQQTLKETTAGVDGEEGPDSKERVLSFLSVPLPQKPRRQISGLDLASRNTPKDDTQRLTTCLGSMLPSKVSHLAGLL